MLVREASATLHVLSRSIEASLDPFSELTDALFLETVGVDADQRRQILERVKEGRNDVDPVVDFLVSHTNGLMYKHLVGRLRSYPIPQIDLPEGHGKTLLDVGCSWGRWSIAAARRGYKVTGIDPSLGAILAARRVAHQLGVEATFIVADARFMPFEDSEFDVVYSYSVLQHFGPKDLQKAIDEIARVALPNGRCQVQLANHLGVRSVYHQLKRGFREPIGFEVRYLWPSQIKNIFPRAGWWVETKPDCFFGLGLQKADSEVMPYLKKILLFASELLKKLARSLPLLGLLADSIFVIAEKRPSSCE
jgi:ubiquinone/menaquinone biosynthesis C-methylase UbiE